MIKCSLITLAVVAVVLLNSGAEARPSRMRSDSVGNPVQCRDELGLPVPWFIVYKSPLRLQNDNNDQDVGNGYFFMQSNIDTRDWTASTHAISSPLSMISRTLAPLYNHKSRGFVGYALYNDQPPQQPRGGDESRNLTRGNVYPLPGYTKGVVVTSDAGGIWMQHSVPKFPNLAGTKYEFPEEALSKGQMFLCLSLDIPVLNDTLAEIFKITNPRFYDSHFPADIAALVPNLVKAVGLPIKQRQITFSSFVMRVAGTNFHVFPKSGKYEKDLYTDILNRKLQSSLNVQTATGSNDRLLSNCSTHSPYNVINVNATKLNDISFRNIVDNSKWVVGIHSDWSCIADLNRMASHRSRGGAATCTSNSNVYHAFKNMVEETESCRILGYQRRPHSSEEIRILDSDSDSWW